jgi:hypothetical protein
MKVAVCRESGKALVFPAGEHRLNPKRIGTPIIKKTHSGNINARALHYEIFYFLAECMMRRDCI